MRKIVAKRHRADFCIATIQGAMLMARSYASVVRFSAAAERMLARLETPNERRGRS